ncbi:DUF4870 domain-containing protein [Chitinophaga lutea]
MELKQEEKTWAIYIHLAGVVGQLIFAPAGNIIAPLILWIIKKSESPFVDVEGKEAVNFQITVSLTLVAINIIFGIGAASWSVWQALSGRPVWDDVWDTRLFTSYGLARLVWMGNLVFSILAIMSVQKGISYRYPVSLRLVK